MRGKVGVFKNFYQRLKYLNTSTFDSSYMLQTVESGDKLRATSEINDACNITHQQYKNRKYQVDFNPS